MTRVTAEAAPNYRAPWERAREQMYQRVKQLAKEKQTTITKMSLALGYSRGGIPNMFKADKGPNFRLLMEIAAYLECHSIEELLGEFGSHRYLEEMRRPRT